MSIEPTYQLDLISASAGYIPLALSRDAHDALLNARQTIRFGISFEQRLDIVIENYVGPAEKHQTACTAVDLSTF
jgi:hypothetical protein